MTLVGTKLVIPLFDAELSNASHYELCDGISLFNLTDDYEKKLRDSPELIARYESSLPHMKVGLAIVPSLILNGEKLDLYNLIELGSFVAMTIRLVTGVPADIPYWFDVEDTDIKGCGISLFRTYRIGRRYSYPLDEGKQSIGLIALQVGISELVQKYLLDSNKNVLIRAIEFAAIGFQTRHIPSRLVNNTIFLESLFSCSNTEISFQIASSISWYLKYDAKSDERLKLFTEAKELYTYRSKIVHGSDISSKNKNLYKNLLFSEEINTLIMQNILNKSHIDIFSMKQNKRQEEMRALTLGADCALLDTSA